MLPTRTETIRDPSTMNTSYTPTQDGDWTVQVRARNALGPGLRKRATVLQGVKVSLIRILSGTLCEVEKTPTADHCPMSQATLQVSLDPALKLGERVEVPLRVTSVDGSNGDQGVEFSFASAVIGFPVSSGAQWKSGVDGSPVIILAGEDSRHSIVYSDDKIAEATVAVHNDDRQQDDECPSSSTQPQIEIFRGADDTEGGVARFLLSASPAPSGRLRVNTKGGDDTDHRYQKRLPASGNSSYDRVELAS